MVKSPLPSVPGFSVYASAAHAWWALRPTIPTATQETQVERKNLDCNMDKGLEHLGEDSSGKWCGVRQRAHLDTTTIAEARARGPGRGAPSIELAQLIGIPSPLPSPHSSVVGRGNRPAAWCQDTPGWASTCLETAVLSPQQPDFLGLTDRLWIHFRNGP